MYLKACIYWCDNWDNFLWSSWSY